MEKILFLSLILVILNVVLSESSSTWAILVAGSRGYEDYDFEGDVCHAYHILRDHGIPKDRIITMMYDDVAYSKSNPTPGVIINWPNGSNVYKGCEVDYRQNEVTPDNFIKILTGNRELELQGKKVLKSKSTDNVFLFMSDHGAPGFFIFPNDKLPETKLRKTLQKIHKEKRYGKMLIYQATCYSGSMYEHLKPHMNILAISASSPTEPDYRCYYDQLREVHLTDYFGSFWMRDIDFHANLDNRTIQDHLDLIDDEMEDVPPHYRSQIGIYGDTSLLDMSLSSFLGKKTSNATFHSRPKCTDTDIIPTSKEEAAIVILQKKIAQEKNTTRKHGLERELEQMLAGRAFMKKSVRLLAEELIKKRLGFTDLLNGDTRLTRNECYENLFEVFRQHCFDFLSHPYTRYQLHVLVNVCEQVNPHDGKVLFDVAEIIRGFCIRHVKGHGLTRIV